MAKPLILVLLFVISTNSHRNEINIFVEYGETSCFSEDFEGSRNHTVEFKTLRGQKIDCWFISPEGKTTHTYTGTSGETFTFLSAPGFFQICFRNPYMSLTRKLVYIRMEPTAIFSLKVRAGAKRPIGPSGPVATSCEKIFEHLVTIMQDQKSNRLEGESGRYFAKELNFKVFYLSVVSSFGMLMVGLGQTIALKRLFEISYPLKGKGDSKFGKLFS